MALDGGPMPGGPGMAPPGPPMSAPPPPQPPDADTIRVSQSPTWDDVLAVLRSDQMRGYRIDIETDATVMQDAEADKQSRIEFVKAAGEMLQQAYQAMTVAPQMLPVIKELFMFSIRGFHAGRSMEETFEDAFEEMAKNLPPPQQGQPHDPAAMAKIDLGKQQLLLDAQKMEKDFQAKQGESAAQAEARQMQFQLDSQKLENDRLKITGDQTIWAQETQSKAQHGQQELALKADHGAKDLALKADGQQKDIMLRAAAHNKSLVDEATAEASGQSPDGARAGPTHLEQLMTQLAQVVVQGHESLAQAQNQLTQAFMQAQKDNAAALSQSHEMHAAQMADLGKRLTAPKRAMKGPDGKWTVETAQ